MSPEVWREVRDIAADALELPVLDRDAFLNARCGTNDALRRQVDKLIARSLEPGPLDVKLMEERRAPILREGELLSDRFEIVRFLANGGMGEVYQANDLDLGESVALKIIRRDIAASPGIAERFRREVHRARQVSHPNVCRIYDLYVRPGEAGAGLFFTMQLIEGPTLAQLLSASTLPLTEAVRFLLDVLAGLEAAHEAGYAHCDLKPNNIIIKQNSAGVRHAVLTDFGLARAADPEDGSASTLGPGVGGGAPAYMPPEALFGGAGARGDLYSFGIVAYEALTGAHPFGRKPVWEVSGSEKPISPRQINGSISPEWNRVILRCLERDPALRFESVVELRASLGLVKPVDGLAISRRGMIYVSSAMIGLVGLGALLMTRGKGGTLTLAVLPFENATKDQSLEYLSEGITESLINSFSQVPKLVVPAVGLVRRYKGTQRPTAAGGELGASAVLVGRIQKRADLLSVEVELIDVDSGRQLWGNQYNLQWTNLIDTQQSITSGILAGLKLPNSSQPGELLARGLTQNDQAFQLYLRGQYLLGQRTAGGLRAALGLFEQAAALDSRFARAYSGIATAELLLAYYGIERPVKLMPEAREAAARAIGIEPRLAEAHSALAAINVLFDWNRKTAEQGFRRALALKEDLAEAHHWFARFVLSPGARSSEAFAEIPKALDSDPASMIIRTNQGLLYYHARRYEDAIQYLQRNVIDVEPAYPVAYWTLGFAWAEMGSLERAVEAHKKAQDLAPGARPDLCLAYSYAACGHLEEARVRMERLMRDYRRPAYAGVEIAFLQAKLGLIEAAFESLENSVQDKEAQLVDAAIDPKMDSLRKYRAYDEFLERVGFQPAVFRGATRV